MAKCISHEECPRCAARGRDRAGDNLGVFSDGGKYCFSCRYRKPPKTPFKILKEPLNDEEKAVLPADFSREIPAAGWKWLLQYGLPYSYWKPFTGFTAAEERLVITHGNPTRVSICSIVTGKQIGRAHV